jgi:hypothetical protein
VTLVIQTYILQLQRYTLNSTPSSSQLNTVNVGSSKFRDYI